MAIKKGNNSANTINGEYTNDDIYGYGGNDYLDGKLGNDRIWGADGADRLLGGAGNDSVWGDAGNDTISGGIGDDMLYGGIGDDRMWGDAGSDRLWGGDGNDQIQTNGVEFDMAYAGNGNDTLTGAANDMLYGEAGNDRFVVELPSNAPSALPISGTYDGGSGTDTLILSMSHADPTMTWHMGSDFLSYYTSRTDMGSRSGISINSIERVEVTGTTGIDYQSSLSSNEDAPALNMTIFGSATSGDHSWGGIGNDTFDGRGGDDVFSGGGGTNTMVGGSGSDEFWLNWNDGISYVKGFEGVGKAGGDTIHIMPDSTGEHMDTTFTQLSNGHTQIKLVDDGAVIATMDIDTVGLKEGYDYLFV